MATEDNVFIWKRLFVPGWSKSWLATATISANFLYSSQIIFTHQQWWSSMLVQIKIITMNSNDNIMEHLIFVTFVHSLLMIWQAFVIVCVKFKNDFTNNVNANMTLTPELNYSSLDWILILICVVFLSWLIMFLPTQPVWIMIGSMMKNC